MSELNRLAADANVRGVLCVDRRDRAIVHSTFDQSRAEALSASVLAALSAIDDQEVRPTKKVVHFEYLFFFTSKDNDDAQLLRIRSKKQEIIAAPRDNFVLIVVSAASGPTTVATIKHA